MTQTKPPKSESEGQGFERLEQLYAHILERSQTGQGYSAQLISSGREPCARKVTEEAIETLIAALTEPRERLIEESADLLFHLLTLLMASKVEPREVISVLEKRRENNARYP